MLLAAWSLLLNTSCSKDDQPDPESGGTGIVADLTFDDGTEIQFGAELSGFSRPTLIHETGSEFEVLAASPYMTVGEITYVVSVMGVIDGPGKYVVSPESAEEETGVSVSLSISRESDAMPESFGVINGEKAGSCVFNITSLTEDHIKGTFSAVLYSDTRKVTIENGEINAGLIRKNVD